MERPPIREQPAAPRTTENTQQLEEKSLLDSSYSTIDTAQMSSQTTSELADNGDD